MLPSLRLQHIFRGASFLPQGSCALTTTTYQSPCKLLTSAYHRVSHDRHHHNRSGGDNGCCSSTAAGNLHESLRILRRPISIWRGPLFSSSSSQQDEKDKDTENGGGDEAEDAEGKTDKGPAVAASPKKGAPVARHLNRDRSKVVPVETSIRYLKSEGKLM